MPMFNAPMQSAMAPPMKRPYVPYSGQSQPAMPSLPGMTPPMAPMAPPSLPDPAMAAAPPPIDPTMTANTTGGPAGPQAPLRAQAEAQLYKLGRQMQGPGNMFAGFNPNAAPSRPDPLAGLIPQTAPEPQQRQLPQLPLSLQAPMVQQAGQQGQPMRPVDRFPRAARLLGRPQLPSPNGQRY